MALTIAMNPDRP